MPVKFFNGLILSCLLLSCQSTTQYDQKKTDLPASFNTLSFEGKKVLIVYGGWEGHQPGKSTGIYVPWLQSAGAEVIVRDTTDMYADSSFMHDIDLIIQTWTMGEISGDQLRGLLTAIRNGTGFAGWHGGIVDAFRGTPDYHFMTGGQFVAHPGDIIDYTVHVTKPDDPIMHGIKDFSIRTERYYMHVDPAVDVLATTTFDGRHVPWLDGVVMPVMWKKTYGKGRVFVNAIGHRLEDHAVPEFQTTMRRGLEWACR